MSEGNSSDLQTVLPYNVGKIRDRYLVVTPFGSWSSLSTEEFNELHSLRLSKDSPTWKKLYEEKVVVDENNISGLMEQIQSLHASWFSDPGLHIVVMSDSCNFNCIYCQAKKDTAESEQNMQPETVAKVLEHIFSVQRRKIRIEIQGGEPLLNWDSVVYLIRNAEKINRIRKKDLQISLVSNLSQLDEEKAEFLIEHNVDISTSLDGPQFLHNKHRVLKSNKGSYEATTKGIKLYKSLAESANITPKIGAVPTITGISLPYGKEIVDEYLKWEFPIIPLQHSVNFIGKAQEKWGEIGFSPEKFIEFWQNSLDYILELNKQGIDVKEQMSMFMLTKILNKRDAFYTELDSPCGAGRSQVAYAPSGDIYTCDEARMIKNKDIFNLGNVRTTKYQDVGKSPNLFYVSESSLMDFWDYNSPFYPWTGTCPVINWEEQESPVVKITQTARKKILDAQFNYLFDKIIFDEDALNIFNSWINN